MIDLSFIIPVYNVERYLAKCLDSILVDNAFTGQVVCVNDGSKDGSEKILEQYARKYPNVDIIAQQNAGLSAARNAGIKAAKGEYVCFLDSDDYWEPNVLGGLLKQIERDKLDVLRFKYQHVNECNEVFNPYKRDYRLENNYSGDVTDGISFLNARMNTQCYAVMFIVRKSILDDCYFTEGIYFEDTDWTPRMLMKAKRVASTDTVVYNYLVRKGSISRATDHSKQEKIVEDMLFVINKMQPCSQNSWHKRMISGNVISIICILSKELYAERHKYLARLKKINIYPIQSDSVKARLINISPRLAVELLHLKNGRR